MVMKTYSVGGGNKRAVRNENHKLHNKLQTV